MLSPSLLGRLSGGRKTLLSDSRDRSKAVGGIERRLSRLTTRWATTSGSAGPGSSPPPTATLCRSRQPRNECGGRQVNAVKRRRKRCGKYDAGGCATTRTNCVGPPVSDMIVELQCPPGTAAYCFIIDNIAAAVDDAPPGDGPFIRRQRHRFKPARAVPMTAPGAVAGGMSVWRPCRRQRRRFPLEARGCLLYYVGGAKSMLLS
ncbi:unnamed protein product [Phaeothamnion confervicola]